MKKESIKKARGVTMLALVVTIIVLLILAAITLNLAVGENGIIERAKLARDKVKNASIAEDEEINKVVEEINSSKNESGSGGSGEGGTCPDVSELEETIKRLQETIANLEQQLENERLNKEELEKQIAEMNKQIEELNRQIEVLKAKQAIGNATVSEVLEGKTFSNSSGVGLVGTMANNGAINANLNAGQIHNIPAGYTTGGTITANSLASQTGGTATAADIKEGKTAWVNGQKITGISGSKRKVYEHGEILGELKGPSSKNIGSYTIDSEGNYEIYIIVSSSNYEEAKVQVSKNGGVVYTTQNTNRNVIIESTKLSLLNGDKLSFDLIRTGTSQAASSGTIIIFKE